MFIYLFFLPLYLLHSFVCPSSSLLLHFLSFCHASRFTFLSSFAFRMSYFPLSFPLINIFLSRFLPCFSLSTPLTLFSYYFPTLFPILPSSYLPFSLVSNIISHSPLLLRLFLLSFLNLSHSHILFSSFTASATRPSLHI